MSVLQPTSLPVLVRDRGPIRQALRERGMATVEYALGVVLVIVIIGAIIVSIQAGWFDVLVQELVKALMAAVQKGFGLDIPWLKP